MVIDGIVDWRSQDRSDKGRVSIRIELTGSQHGFCNYFRLQVDAGSPLDLPLGSKLQIEISPETH